MHKLEQKILQTAHAALQKPAITATGEFKDSYDKNMVNRCISYVPESLKQKLDSELKILSAEDDPYIAQMNLISSINLAALRQNARGVVKDAIEKMGEGVVEAVISKAEQLCKASKLNLVHVADYQPTADAGANQKIIDGKKLTSPKVRKPMDTETMVYCAPVLKTAEQCKDEHFLIKDIPPELLARSTQEIQVPNGSGGGKMLVVGGNHMEAAWFLITVAGALKNLERSKGLEIAEKRDAVIQHSVDCIASETLIDFRAPHSIDLKGHYHVKDGEETEMKEARVAKKAAHKKKEIKPTEGNEHLKKGDMGRGKPE